MAAHSTNFIRVRLHFDYPPPAVVDCRMCWLLVDLNTCRVVGDLESIIREKFEFSRRSILNLFIEDCYLPHTESVFVVRDNDSVRVKVDCLSQVNGHSSRPDTASQNCRKRQRPAGEDGPGENGASVEWKKKKRKKGSEESLERDAKQASGDEKNKKSQGKRKEKKKKKKAEENGLTVTPKPAASTKKTPAKVGQPPKSTKKPPVAQAKTQNVSSSDSSSSSSKEDEAPKKPPVQKPAPKTPTAPAASKTLLAAKPTQTKPHPPSSSSSATDSSSDEATRVKSPPKSKPLTSTTSKGRISENSKCQQAPAALQSTNCAQKQAASATAPPLGKTAEPCTSSSEEEIELVIRRPMQQLVRGGGSSQSSWRGSGRAQPIRGGPGERGRGEGRGGTRGHNGSFEFSYNGAMEPSYQTDSITNLSVVLQNGAESAPKQDYSSMPLLAAPPQVGQKIAFKLLELTENYTPEVSEYKEGKIVSFDPTTKQIELEVHNAFQAPVEPGKFDLVYQNPDGSERVEYAVSRSSRVTERWESLLEPRLII
ncbi:coilin [Dicentrarchus labrax]|uniref:Coilin p80 n=1 Tax=Dicentrarchus labrax TaxID=13489 RepID=A0A8C4ILL7_DICLA|nr:coilin [Dicentrarchus labrax]